MEKDHSQIKQEGVFMYQMKPEYFTGIELIDKEHTKLFALAQDTYEVLQDDISQDKSSELVRLVSELIDYTRTHFSDEEAYQKSIQYPYLKEHAAQHRQFEESLASLDLDGIEHDLEAQNETVQSLLDFLTNWLVNHILKVDKLLAE